MAKTAKITLDGVDYTIHAFNVKELREVGKILQANGANVVDQGTELVAIAMRRAEPSADFETLEPSLPELNEATAVILKLAGVEMKQPDPQAAAPVAS